MFIKFRITSEFEPESWHDYALIPWWWARWWFAWGWFHGWRLCKIIRFRFCSNPYELLFKWMESRSDICPIGYDWWNRSGTDWHTDVAPYCCPRCLWSGPVRWLVHTYEDDGIGEDAVYVDECPRCGLGL